MVDASDFIPDSRSLKALREAAASRAAFTRDLEAVARMLGG